MITLSLAEIAHAVDGTLVVGDSGTTGSTTLSGEAQTDSRLIEPGQLFVAKRGEDTDGHLFVGAAIDRGAALAIVEHDTDSRIAQIVVEDAVVALGKLAREVVARLKRDHGLTVIGITGSNGKTTTKNLLNAMLSTAGETVAPVGSFNNEVGAPLTMLQATASTKFLISEMGADGVGDIAKLANMAQPDIGVVLMVGLSHVGRFGGIEVTARTKAELVAALPSTGVAVLNQDDPRVAAMAENAQARVLWFGQTAAAGVRATDVRASATGTTFTVHVPSGESAEVHFRVLGEHHVGNALAAFAVAYECGVLLPDAVAAIEGVVRAERWRMEVLPARDGITIINDAYNASPDAMTAALKTLALIRDPGQRTVAVLGAMSELGEFSGDEHDRIGLQAVRFNISRIVVVGDEARRMHITAINEGSWDGESVFFSSQDEAFAYLANEISAGDLVLVKSSNSAGLRFLGDRLGAHFA
ncbi:UDP-N-acetylmuramoyl-tripeptide--D-alanyl-D-alanine ligase [Lysinibacter cavernae]|uniref:UDP-N-acetylmuramoyl-tripeptide--D-alanyl-D-alanine ligase n=1 Tax=Lysinibacter cavernae TaxID=1640652 RepID=A0A7X5TTB0_9MICO|nr:UDP-N-acetylmuramoyl-tripeptide--D-alanyl-D-alanine ligase [Lysinibacter cavernae]NIH53093.1 UDP-N-acetylmuramoyl-tripeptide--D-alanyl-D-alanine ligase [Lysinibacter cavernae]